MKLPIIILSMLVLCSCSFLTSSPQKKIRTNLLGYKRSDIMDPAKLRFAQEYIVIDNVTAKLVEVNGNSGYRNELAKEVKFSEDKMEIDITLKNAVFSDGSPITAKDVEMSLKRAIIKGTPHANIKNLWVGSDKLTSIDQNIDGLQVLSDKKLKLKLTHPTKEILFFMSLIDLAVLHKTQYEKDTIHLSDWEKVTSGPYHVSYTESGVLKLVANPKSNNFDKSIPSEVTFESYKGDDVINRLKDKSLDFGVITFNDYLQNMETVESVTDFDIVSNKTDGIVHINLNSNSKIFKKDENRRWVQKKILEAYKIDKKYGSVASKAKQFFLPNAKGHISEAEIDSVLKDVDISKVPSDLKEGFTIKTIEGMKYYMPSDLSKTLSEVLGIRVTIDATIPGSQYMKLLQDRNFDAMIIGTGMSYRVLGEALNLQYLSKNPSLLDPTGKITKLLKKYQNKENNDEEFKIIEKIMTQMVEDSECIPLYYFSSPMFIKNKTLEAKNINVIDSIRFYKMRTI